MPGDEERARQREIALPFVRHVKDSFQPKRQFRRRDAGRSALSEIQHVQCVLLEYGQRLPKSNKSKEGKGEEEGVDETETVLKGGLDAVQGNLEFLSGKRIGALVGMQADAIRGLTAEYEEHGKVYGDGGSARDPEAAARHAKAQAVCFMRWPLDPSGSRPCHETIREAREEQDSCGWGSDLLRDPEAVA